MKTSSFLAALATLLPLVSALPTEFSVAETAVSATIRLLAHHPILISIPNRTASSRDRPHALGIPAPETLTATEGVAETV